MICRKTNLRESYPCWCRLKSRTGCHHNVDLISETYEAIAMGKLQIPQFQPPNSSLTTDIQVLRPLFVFSL